MSDPQRLEELRAEIDRLDTVLHDTLMARAEVVAEVARAKAASSGTIGTALRPDREAAMARRLAERHEGPFPLHSLQRVWREIVNATTQEVQMRYAVHLGPVGVEAFDAVRYAFGNATELVRHDTVAAALEAAGEAEGDIAALPLAGEPWWDGLPERAGIIMRVADMLVVGPRMSLDWDHGVAIARTVPPGMTLLAEGQGGTHLVAGAVGDLDPAAVIRHIGGYMDAPWVSPDRGGPAHATRTPPR